MERIERLSRPKLWRPLLLGLFVLLLMGAASLSNWYVLDQRERAESQRRFALDTQAIGQAIQARLQAYEMVLRGVSAAFFGEDPNLSYAEWAEVIEQLRVQELYPGITSVAWARAVPADQMDSFLQRIQGNGRTYYAIFPPGPRAAYLPIEYIGPINSRTRQAVGLDLLTQEHQTEAIQRAIDEGHTTLSQPMVDLYMVSPEISTSLGALMYFPVYRNGIPPATVDERRTAFLGMTTAAFRGQELASGIFGEQLHLFHIVMHHVQTNAVLFDSALEQAIDAPADWQPSFQTQLNLSLYGRDWRVDVTATPNYERSLAVGRGHRFTLILGLSVALLMAILAGYFYYQHEYQLHLRELVTQRLRDDSEQLVLANRYKSEFLANMSHELRTPLNSILILSDQLRQNGQGNLSEKQVQHADILHRAGSDLLQLINDVLDLAKIEAGRMQISLEPINIQDVLIDMDAAIRPLAQAKQLHLSLSAELNVPKRVYTDRVRLHQILRNLLSNAIKFTDVGTVQLTIRLEKTLDDGRSLLNFSVHDTGIGIDPSLHEQVFHAFSQVDGSSRRRFGGTGLGLAITRQLAQALGGEVTLSSTLGQGSTFSALLPMQSAPPLPQTEHASVARVGTGIPLLIVEDDPNFATIIIDQAREHGFACVHCTTGTQAQELLRTEPFAAVILDILLPDISGWQVLRRMRASTEHRQTPVHIISCLPESEAAEPDAHYLTKPIGNDTLRQLFASLQAESKALQGVPLLLVEDVENEREHYAAELTTLGFEVTAVENAQTAARAWQEKHFGVLVLDLNLPDRDGFTLLDDLEKLHSLNDTRVIVNTGIDVTQHGLQRLSAYSAVVVRKHGADTAELGQAVQGFLGQIRPQVATPVNDAASSDPLHGQRILLVDDDVRNVYAMGALLDDFGVSITTASNGEEAIDLFGRETFDLILMDMSMPVMDGYTATTLLKTEHDCRIPIIALTAHAMKGDREKCLAAGADDYLAKPVERETLRAMLDLWLGSQPSPAPAEEGNSA